MRTGLPVILERARSLSGTLRLWTMGAPVAIPVPIEGAMPGAVTIPRLVL